MSQLCPGLKNPKFSKLSRKHQNITLTLIKQVMCSIVILNIFLYLIHHIMLTKSALTLFIWL